MMKKRFQFSLILFIFFSIFLATSPVKADVAPPPAQGYGGLEPFEYQQTEVQMVYERVEMELKILPQEEGEYSPDYQVDVVAWFVMRNHGSTAESMQAMFPTENFFSECLEDDELESSFSSYDFLKDSFSVEIDGIPAPVTEITTAHPQEGTRRWCEEETLHWAAFDVTFPVDRDVLIRVEYILEGDSSDAQNIYYILETGGAWKGPIETAYVIFRFPYLATDDPILSRTTPGYQTLYNEIFWSYRDFEPTDQDNILISIVAPNTWKKIQEMRDRIAKDPDDADAWLQLAQNYFGVSNYKRDTWEPEYYQKAQNTYLAGIQANPENPKGADLYAAYAYFLLDDCCWWFEPGDPVPDSYLSRIIPLLDKAFTYEPSNQTALDVLMIIESNTEGFEYEFPPTAVPSFTPTPTETIIPTPTSTPRLTRTTWVHPPTSTRPPTRTPKHTENSTFTPTSTTIATATTRPSQTSAPTRFLSPTPTPMSGTDNNNTAITGIGAVIVVGMIIIAVIVLRKRKR